MAISTMSLDELVAQLRQVHSDRLRAIVLYGSAASGEQVAGQSDQNVLVLVTSLSVATLQTLSQTARAWNEAGNIAPLTITEREWRRSTDIYPMEYADILERHRVLFGTLPLDNVHVDSRHLRLQVEQEAMGKLLRLRRGVMSAGTDRERQTQLLRASLSAVLVIFRGVLRLHGETPERDATRVAVRVGVCCGFDSAPFERVVALVHGRTLNATEIEPTLAGYVAGMEALVQYLDRFTPPTPSADSHHS